MTTALEVFSLAMALIDSLSESSGAADIPDNNDSKARTPAILNILRGELYPYSDTYSPADFGRAIAAVVYSMDDVLDLDDYICQSVLPYGLAYHLVLAEDQVAANLFLQRYQELVAKLARGMPSVSEDITDVYGGIGYGQFVRW
jgi:hypothetical protein